MSKVDYKNYKIARGEIVKILKKAEKNSNYRNTGYSFLIEMRKTPNMLVKGWVSRVINKDGSIDEVIFIDFDGIFFDLMKSELKYIMKEYNLSPFYIFTSFEDKKEEGIAGNYLAISLTKRRASTVREILKQTHCDNSYRLVCNSYVYRSWVTRLSGKGKKKAPKFKCVVGDLSKKYNQDVSQGHLNVMKKIYPEIPHIKYTNLDEGKDIFLVEYLTASK